MGGDSLPLFNPVQLSRYLSAWNSWVDLGSSVPMLLAGPPPTDAAFFSALGVIGVDGPTAAWLYVALFSIVGATGTAYLFRVAFPRFRSSQLASVLAGLVFLFNPSIVVDTFKSLMIGLPERAVFPLFLGLFINGHQNRKIRFAICSGVLSCLLLGRFPFRTDEYLVAMVVSTSAYVALATVWSSKQKPAMAFTSKYLLLTLVTGFVVNIYIFASAFVNLNLYSSTLNSFTPRFTLNNWSTFFNSIRLLGHWGFYAGYVPYSSVYNSNFVVILATLALPCFSFLTLLMDKTKRVAALAAATGVLLFLSKGSNEPLGQIFVTITSTPILKVFYLSSYLAPFVVLGYSLLIPTFFARIDLLNLSKIRPYQRMVRASILLVMISGMLVASWPIVTGDVSINYYQPLLHGVNIPTEYRDLNNWLSSNANPYRTMLAYDPSVYISTDWGLQGATQFYQLYFSNPIVTGTGTQYSKTETFLEFIYHPNHFVNLNPDSAVNVDNGTPSPWTSYQGDTISTSPSGYSSHPAVHWQTQSSNGTSHEIAYFLSAAEDWTANELLSLWVNQSVDLSTLSFGIGDNSNFVGWYSAIKHVATARQGWVQILLPIRTPDNSAFNATSVKSLWAMDSAISVSVDFSFFQIGKLGHNSIGWAKLLAIAGVKWVIRDDSLVQGKWQDYGILENANAFNAVFREGVLRVYENLFTPNGLYGATSVLMSPNMLYVVSSVNESSFDLTRSAFVLNSTFPISQFSSSSSTQVVLRNRSDQSYEVEASSSSPFILVLDEQFDPRWSITDSTGLSFTHIQINGYANGWLIPHSGIFQFRLTFSPQKYYSLTLLASLFSAILALVIVAVPGSRFVKTARNWSHRVGFGRPGTVGQIEPKQTDSLHHI